MNLSPSDLFYYALTGKCSNDFIVKCYNEMKETDKLTLLKERIAIDEADQTEHNNNQYKSVFEFTFDDHIDNSNMLFKNLVETNNYKILSDLLRLFKNKNFNILCKTFYCSMKSSDYKCFVYLINENLFYNLELADKNKIVNILQINAFYTWLKNNSIFCNDLSKSSNEETEINVTSFL